MRKKALVTGSLGLTGSAVVELLKTRGWEVVGIDANLRSYFFNTERQPDAGHLDVDLRDEVAMEEVFQAHHFDAIIHTAGQPSHDWATNHVLLDFDINARASIILFELMRKYCPQATVIHVSTDKVYGENMITSVLDTPTRFHSHYPFDEMLALDDAGVRSYFGCSKTAADLYAQEYAAHGHTVAVFRPGCITGSKHQGAEQHGFLAYMAKCVKEGIPYKVFGFQGKQVRDQIHAYDLARAFLAVLEKPQSGVYNIGGGPERSVSVLEALAKFEELTGKKAIYEFHSARLGDRMWDVHDVSLFRANYPHWDYQFDLDAIFKDLV